MSESDWRRFAAVGGLEQFGRDRRLPDVSGMTSPVRCTSCDHVYDLGAITDYGRYTDCTVWKCPGCKITVSDRPHAWGHDHHFEELDRNGRVTRRNY